MEMPNYDEPGSITQCLHKLHEDGANSEAQRRLFSRYYRSVVERAGKRTRRLAVIDESDVAMVVWDAVLQKLKENECHCADRQEFEELLGKVTYHKAISLYHWVKRPCRFPTRRVVDDVPSDGVSRESTEVLELYYLCGYSVSEIATACNKDMAEIEQVLATHQRSLRQRRYQPIAFSDFNEAELQGLDESPLAELLFQELVDSFDASLKETILLKLEGRENAEIATMLHVSKRQIERRLKLVKELLIDELRS